MKNSMKKSCSVNALTSALAKHVTLALLLMMTFASVVKSAPAQSHRGALRVRHERSKDNHSITLRPAQKKDTAALEDLFLITRRATFPLRPANEFQPGDYVKSVSAQNDDVWIAEDQGKIVGFMSINLAPHNFIHNLFVHPDHQGRGIGKMLLNLAGQLLGRPMRLRMVTDNRTAGAFYEKMGWKIEGYSQGENSPCIDYIKY